jgi:homoserine kinase
LALVPEVADVFSELRRRNIPVCLSGAGPSLLAFPLDGAPEITHDLLDVPSDWKIWPLEIRAEGFEVFDG